MHHQGEVVIPVDGAADALIVFQELIKGDHTIGHLGVPLRHELSEYLVWGLLALNHLWVLACVIDLSNVAKLHQSVLVHVKFVIGLLDPLLPLLIDLSLYSN